MKRIVYFNWTNNYLLFLFAISFNLLLFSSSLSAQTVNSSRVIKGVVMDQTKTPLIGVNIFEEGSKNGTVSNLNGEFELVVEGSESILRFSYIGYKDVNKKVTDKFMSIYMEEDVNMLDEVVAIGYGTSTKKEITGSISSIKSDDFVKGNVSDPLQLLQGKVAGMNIIKPNGGDPNGSFMIQLRGMTTLSGGASPLIVVDGIPGGDLNSITPEEIESIDVLKDGSAAAIYGTRGTNGVILVTTKQARKKENSRFEFSTYAALQQVNRKIEVLDANQFREVLNEYFPNQTQLDYGHSTDWFDEVTRNAPISQYYNLATTGGNDMMGYRASLSFQDDQGLVEKTSKKKLRARMNFFHNFLDERLKIDYNLSYSTSKGELADNNILAQALKRNPTEPVYDIDNNTPQSGGYYYNPSPFNYHNPVAMVNESTRENESRMAMGSAKASLAIIDGLKGNIMGSMTQYSSNTGTYLGRYYPIGFGTNGSAEISKASSTNMTLETNIDYKKMLAEKHSFQLIGGYSYNKFVSENTWNRNYLFDTDLFSYHNIGAGSALKDGKAGMSSYKESNKLIAFFARFMYNYDEKYLFSASIRHEGSSRFGKNNKWGNFPAVSAGWRINREDFMTDVKWIDDLKLRVGYGVTGNQEISNYQSLELLKKSGAFYYKQAWINTYAPASNPNPNLKWERKGEFNVGLDFSFISGRISGALDYYNRTTSDLLYWYSVPVPPNLFNQTFMNVGEIQNSGVELSLNTVPVLTKDFKWNLMLNLSHNKNKLTKFSNEDYTLYEIRTGYLGDGYQQYTQKIVEGGSIGNFWGPRYLGIGEDGEPIFKDKDGNGQVNEEDYEIIGNAYPDLLFSISSKLTWKNWDLDFLFRGALGNDVLNVNRMYNEGLNNFGSYNILESTLDNIEYKGTNVYSDYFIEDGSFLKLDNLTLGYNFRTKAKYISKLHLYFTAQNLFTITKYKGVDPEVSLSGLEPGIDWTSYYPRTTTFLIGLNINLK